MKKIVAKTCLYTACAFLVVLFMAKGCERENVRYCLEQKRICDGWYDVHDGDCAECRIAKECRKDGVI